MDKLDYGPPDCTYCKPNPSKYDRDPPLYGCDERKMSPSKHTTDLSPMSRGNEPAVTPQRPPRNESPMFRGQGHPPTPFPKPSHQERIAAPFPKHPRNKSSMPHGQESVIFPSKHERDLPPLPRGRERAASSAYEGNNQSQALDSTSNSAYDGLASNHSSSLSSMTQSSYSSAPKLSGSLPTGGLPEQTIRETLVPAPLLLNTKSYRPNHNEDGTQEVNFGDTGSLQVPVLKKKGHSHLPTVRQGIPHPAEQEAEYGLATPPPFASAKRPEALKIFSQAFEPEHYQPRHERMHSTPESPTYDQLRFDRSEKPPLQPDRSMLHRTPSVPVAKIDLTKANDLGLDFEERTPTQANFRRKKSDDSLAELLNYDKKKGPPVKKQLFGEKGWLGRTPSMKEDPDEKFNKKSGLKSISSKIKQQVEDWTENKSKGHDFDVLSKPTVAISLDPQTQAKLSCELELMIVGAANIFLKKQHKAGRMSQSSINKIMEMWNERNRPPVVDFQFDQGTQRDLVMYNMGTFTFEGEAAANNVVLKATLQQWKAVAKEMGVRTFCTPDSAIRLLLLDIQKILEMLGAPAEMLLAFQELQMSTLSKMHEQFKSEIEARVARGSAVLEHMKREGFGA